MATSSSTAHTDPHTTDPAPFLVAERTGKGTYLGRNERGAEVAIGPEGNDGVFSPGELLAIAVAACNGMSADSRIASERGDDVGISVGVSRTKLEGENRYERLAVELVIHAPTEGSEHSARPAMSAERTERMIAGATKAIAALCTVSRTLEAGADIDLVITAEEPASAAPSKTESDAESDAESDVGPDAASPAGYNPTSAPE